MEELRKKYEAILKRRQQIGNIMKELLKNPEVLEYYKLIDKNDDLESEQTRLYREIRLNEFKSCKHIKINIKKLGNDYRFYEYYEGCIKCGLLIKAQDYHYWGIPDFEKTIMRQAIVDDGAYYSGVNTDIICNFYLARAIYKKIKEHHPDIDDETAIHYLKVALNDIDLIKVNDERKASRIKRLSLSKDFCSWGDEKRN